jgi:sec-independent protein translocase protein TatA
VFNLGVPELIFILVLALLIFGPKRLPEIGRTLGKGLTEFRRASNELKRSIETEMSEIDDTQRPAVPRLQQRPPAGTAAAGEHVAEPTAPASGPPPLAPQ